MNLLTLKLPQHFTLAMLLFLLPFPAIAQDLDRAKDFVSALYHAYEGKTNLEPEYLGKDAPKVFTPELLALIRRDQAQAQGEVGLLGHDPICACQDFEISKIKVTVRAKTKSSARAVVNFLNAGQPQTVTLDLRLVAGQWRVSDVHESKISSLLRFLASNGKTQ